MPHTYTHTKGLTFTKGGAPGAGERQKLPAIGHLNGGWEDFGFPGAGNAGAEGVDGAVPTEAGAGTFVVEG